MRIRTLELVTFALLGAVLVVAQIALAFLPNVEIVSLLVYVYAQVFRKKALIPIYIFVLAEGLIYGFTIWWITYLYVWAVLAVVTMVIDRKGNTIVCATVISLFGLSFGMLCAIPTFLIGGPGAGWSFFVAGIPFDMAHFAGNLAAALVLYYPLYSVLSRLGTGIGN